jgi:hypothetical protein
MAAYYAAVAATGVSVEVRDQEPREAGLLLAVLPVMHFGWGFGTLVGALRFGPPLAALQHLAGLSGRATAVDDAEPVYAPSLRDGHA